MMRPVMRLSLLAVLIATSGCIRHIREHAVELQAVAGVPVNFVTDTSCEWNFGDGAPAEKANSISHVFARKGTWFVTCVDRGATVEWFTVLVRARSAAESVPRGVTRALMFHDFAQVSAAVDFAEHLGAGRVSDWVDRDPLVGLALENPGPPFDASEGLAAFEWADGSAVSIGVDDERLALVKAGEWLQRHQWHKGDRGEYSLDGQTIELEATLGTLYSLHGDEAHRALNRSRIITADSRGLLTDGAAAPVLSDGFGVQLYVANQAQPGTAAVVANVSFEAQVARVEGLVIAGHPLWRVVDEGSRLLDRGPEGAVAAFSAPLRMKDLNELVTLLDGPIKHTRELDAFQAALAGPMEGVVVLDAHAVLGEVVQGRRPSFQGAVLLEAPVTDAALTQALVAKMLSEADLPLTHLAQGPNHVFETAVKGLETRAVVTPEALFLSVGTAAAARPESGLRKLLQSRGGFGPGHLSLWVDVGEMLRQLKDPAMVRGLDVRKALQAQALIALLVEQLIPLERLVFDAEPTPKGAHFTFELAVRPRSSGVEP